MILGNLTAEKFTRQVINNWTFTTNLSWVVGESSRKQNSPGAYSTNVKPNLSIRLRITILNRSFNLIIISLNFKSIVARIVLVNRYSIGLSSLTKILLRKMDIVKISIHVIMSNSFVYWEHPFTREPLQKIVIYRCILAHILSFKNLCAWI